ncbi:helix-turn-helix transcriptional regulator [Faecalicatena contorta]|uniref:Helix-turn-helix domain-containing protein n=1 Tax=Faecalicatena contorta TaxID=39482 RepID=A0A316A2H0_9FIRM|nr:AraC family transcriptional regulator [Faecalicatena contorta]PWJ51845.1 AraC family transcriptional regulator [Faecalicatena contorta]SUQ12075.1 Helix-turn-helix domain-containing protein [Faecalicatena contorta]
MELNNIVRHYATTLFQLRGVYRYHISAENYGIQKTAPYPGFIFPLSGCAEYQFNGTPYLIRPGTVVHGLASSTMRKRVVGKQDWEYISVLYETYKEPPGIQLAKTHFSLSPGQSPRLYDLLHQLYAVFSLPGSLSAFQAETLFRGVLEETFLCARQQTKHGAQELFESVSEYIHTHYMDELTVSLLAQQNGVNENRLFYVFQKYAGMGPGDYLRSYRLNRAKDLLVTSSIPIGIIAAQTGYPDALYFSRIFKKHFGVSPSKFREE